VSNWVPCANCGKKNNISYKTKGLVQRCRYCGEIVLGTGPASSALVINILLLIVLCFVAAFCASNGIK
jgi:hypothetical protein